MFWLLGDKQRQRQPGRIRRDEVQISVVDYGIHYRVEFNFGGVYYTTVTKVVVPPNEPSHLCGFEGMTADEAYQYRKENDKPEKGSQFGWIVLRETEPIKTEEQIQKAISDVLEQRRSNGYEWSKVTRYNQTVQEFVSSRRRNRY